MKVTIETERRFIVPANQDAVFAVLSDVPRSVSHYPQVDRLLQLEDGVYRWELEKQGAAGVSHQVIYACRYVSDARAGTVTWSPISGVGNGEIQGSWRLSQSSSGTKIDFYNSGELDVPAPRLLKKMVGGFVKTAFDAQIDTYITNLSKTFSQS